MAWPETLNFIFSGPGKSCARLVLFVSIPAKKNNYSLGPFLTNENCILGLNGDSLQGQMELIERASPMDYEPVNLQDVSEIIIEIESRQSLTERHKRIQPFYPNEAMHLQGLLEDGVTFIPKQVRRTIHLDAVKEAMHVELDDLASPSA